ncbi:hypothetical protein T08_16520 [Trichinella sp. T8]|nr:hypothetical protein T08_16520 [Trichinella sp. T8]
MRLDQPQKGRSSDKCETVNALGICCYVEIKSNQKCLKSYNMHSP